MSIEKVVLAVDPGSAKCGLALVRRSPEGKIELLWRKISPSDDLVLAVDEAFAISLPTLVIVGSGTKSKDTIHAMREHMPAIAILVVDERDTTMQARERYWEHHQRRGWRRLLPSTLQVPPVPVDDFVALILAERVLID